jgi:hypothetical protein
MTRQPRDEHLLSDVHGVRMSWSDARQRLQAPEFGRTYWLSTIRPDGSPHVVPLIALWHDDALYFITGPGTRAGQTLAADGRCVLATQSATLPSVDLVLEGVAVRVADEAGLASVAAAYRADLQWPLEVTDGGLDGPNAPSAGPPPYNAYRFEPRTVFGLPGLAGSDTTTNPERMNAVRWRF